MAASDDFKQLIRAGNVAEALQLAFTEAIELTITTRLTPDETTDLPNPIPQIQTRIDLLAGTITTDVSPDICTDENYAALGTIHSDQVREGCQVIQDNLANLQTFLSTWIDVFGKSGTLPITPSMGITVPPPVASEGIAPPIEEVSPALTEPEPEPVAPAPPFASRSQREIAPELAAGLGVAALTSPPPLETSLPETPPALLDVGDVTTIEAGPDFEEETFIQSQEPDVDSAIADLSLPTPPTEETEAAAAIAMDELFGEPQDIAVSEEAVAEAARELANAGADLGFDEETFVQALEPSDLSAEPEISEETFIQDLEPSETFPTPELAALAQAPEAPETWEAQPEPSAIAATPDLELDLEMLAGAADMVDDSWLQELESPETQETAEPEPDLGLEPEPPSPGMATDALVDALLAADQAAEFPTPDEEALMPPAASEPDFDDLSWATPTSDATPSNLSSASTADDLSLRTLDEQEPASAEPGWDELSAFADTAQQPDPWEAVEAAATPDWLAEEEMFGTSPTPETSEILEDFDPSLFADEASGNLEDGDLAAPAAGPSPAALQAEAPAAPIPAGIDSQTAPTAAPESPDTELPAELPLDANASFAEFDATLFPDDTRGGAVSPDLGLEALEGFEEASASEAVALGAETDPLAGLFTDTGPSTADFRAEIEDFMPTAVSEPGEAASPADAYDPLAALFDDESARDFANILDEPEALPEDDPLAAFDIDPFADALDDSEEPT